jgi:large subunit ribosomal protein L9
MKIILLKDVDKVGSMGEEITVKDGFARNYLIPQRLAIKSTKGAVKVLEQKQREKERREKKLIEQAREIAEKIQQASCTISMEAGEEDKLFGAVTSEMIAETLLSEDIELDRKQILLEEPIKALGVYNVDIRLHPEVKTQLRVWVVKK